MQKWEHARLRVFWHDEERVDGKWTKRGWYYTDPDTGQAWMFSALRELDTWLGDAGWELVSVTPEVTGWSPGATTTHIHWLYFKRPELCPR